MNGQTAALFVDRVPVTGGDQVLVCHCAVTEKPGVGVEPIKQVVNGLLRHWDLTGAGRERGGHVVTQLNELLRTNRF